MKHWKNLVTYSLLVTAGAALGWCISGFTPSFDTYEDCALYHSGRAKTSKGAEIATDVCYDIYHKNTSQDSNPDIEGVDLSGIKLPSR